ncbi:MAG: zinc ribbon domain-containing protein [Clostridia bacterium]|nr:zinc ribbon domain-containing protein [Clostridia bacterium]NCC42649.1 zinc ribbon domain-containing protein [Clostridia bacterium]
MNNYCMKCGKQIKPGAKFCPFCGEKIPTNVQQNVQSNRIPNVPPNTTANMASNMMQNKAVHAAKTRPVWIYLIPVAAVLALVIIISLVIGIGRKTASVIGSKGYEKPIEMLEEGIQEDDGQLKAKAFGMEEGAYLPYVSSWHDGSDMRIDIKSAEKIEKDELETELSSYNVQQAEEATDGYIVEVSFVATPEGKDEYEVDAYLMPVIKADGDWIIGYTVIGG